MENTLVQQISNAGIIAICRKIYGKDLLLLAEALRKGGITFMEVTYDQSSPDCIEKTTAAIRALCAEQPTMRFGAGTVLTREQVEATRDAGGQFVISPNTDISVIEHTKKLGMVSIPGAMTPSEIMAAHNAGADFVKLFPCGYLGVRYIKDITAPLSHIKLVGTGGITADTFGEYLKAGICGAGIGSVLSQSAQIKAGEWDAITKHAAQYMEVFRSHKKEL